MAKSFKDIDVGQLYALIQRIDENKKWRKKYKESKEQTTFKGIC